MSKPKGKCSVKRAAQVIFDDMPRFQKFSIAGVHADVTRLIGRPRLKEDTTRRKLFEYREEMRREGRELFKCLDNHKSIYQKN